MPQPKDSPKKSQNSAKNEGQNEERGRFEEAMRAIFSVPYPPKRDTNPKKKDDRAAGSSSSG